MTLIIVIIVLCIVFGNINKKNTSISKLNKEIEDLNEKEQEKEKQIKKFQLKEKIRNLKNKIRKIEKKMDDEELEAESSYFKYLCEQAADLQMELYDYEFELEWIDKNTTYL
mgnify:FL=1